VEDAYLRLAGRGGAVGGEVFNLGTGVQTSLSEVVELARRIYAIPDEPRWGSLPAREWDTSIWRANSTKITAATGWRPAFLFEQGFRETVEWFRSRPEWERYYSSVIGI
jgi:UDP-glucose 4-epimerase